MCRVLGVSTSGYYAWLRREPSPHRRSDAALARKIESSHQRSRGTYGAPRVRADLAVAGHPVSRKQVARLMRALGLQGVSRRRSIRTTRRDESARPAPDLVERDFTVDGPNRLWVADITYIPT